MQYLVHMKDVRSCDPVIAIEADEIATDYYANQVAGFIVFNKIVERDYRYTAVEGHLWWMKSVSKTEKAQHREIVYMVNKKFVNHIEIRE